MAYVNTQSVTRRADSGILSRLVERYRAYRLYRETYEGLSALSNRELADLGLSRGELHTVALKATRR